MKISSLSFYRTVIFCAPFVCTSFSSIPIKADTYSYRTDETVKNLTAEAIKASQALFRCANGYAEKVLKSSEEAKTLADIAVSRCSEFSEQVFLAQGKLLYAQHPHEADALGERFEDMLIRGHEDFLAKVRNDITATIIEKRIDIK